MCLVCPYGRESGRRRLQARWSPCAFEVDDPPCPRSRGQGQPLRVTSPQHLSSLVPPVHCSSRSPLCTSRAQRAPQQRRGTTACLFALARFLAICCRQMVAGIVTRYVTCCTCGVAILTFRHKGLERFFLSGTTAGIRAKHADSLRLILGRLHVAAVFGSVPGT
jgi:hypothetical protein